MNAIWNLVAIAAASERTDMLAQILPPLTQAFSERGMSLKKASVCNGQAHDIAREIGRAWHDGATHVLLVGGLQGRQRSRTMAGIALAWGVLNDKETADAAPLGAAMLGQKPDEAYCLAELDRAILCLPTNTSAALTLLNDYCQNLRQP